MASPESPNVRILREAVRRALRGRSLRTVAKEIRMSTMGVSSFLEGGSPYAVNEMKLMEWYLVHGIDEPEPSAGTVRVIRALLVDGFPPEERDAGAKKLADAMMQVYRKAGLKPPAWMEKLKEMGPED